MELRSSVCKIQDSQALGLLKPEELQEVVDNRRFCGVVRGLHVQAAGKTSFGVHASVLREESKIARN